jgi:hypothetical protein
MDKKGFEEINTLLGFEMFDKRAAVVYGNIEKFKQKLPDILEKPNDLTKDNIKSLYYLISNLCWKQDIYFSSLQNLNKSQGTQQSLSDVCIPVFNISELPFYQLLELFGIIQDESIGKNNLAAFSLDFGKLKEADLLIQLCRIASAALLHNYKGPLFVQADQLKFDGTRFENDREKLLEELKQKTRQAIHLGIFNINYDASELTDPDASRISEKMLMNLKMVAMATNLWVRNFQPNNLIVSVSGKMGASGDSLPANADVKEFIQRLLKEGSRLRFGVSGEDISKLELPISKMDNILVNQINQLNEVLRHDLKLGGVVVDAGTISEVDDLLPFADLKLCELKIAPGKTLFSKKNLKTIFDRCGIGNQENNLKELGTRLSQFPKVTEFLN